MPDLEPQNDFDPWADGKWGFKVGALGTAGAVCVVMFLLNLFGWY